MKLENEIVGTVHVLNLESSRFFKSGTVFLLNELNTSFPLINFLEWTTIAVTGSTSVAIFSKPDLDALCIFPGCDVTGGILCHVSQLRHMETLYLLDQIEQVESKRPPYVNFRVIFGSRLSSSRSIAVELNKTNNFNEFQFKYIHITTCNKYKFGSTDIFQISKIVPWCWPEFSRETRVGADIAQCALRSSFTFQYNFIHLLRIK